MKDLLMSSKLDYANKRISCVEIMFPDFARTILAREIDGDNDAGKSAQRVCFID